MDTTQRLAIGQSIRATDSQAAHIVKDKRLLKMQIAWKITMADISMCRNDNCPMREKDRKSVV